MSSWVVIVDGADSVRNRGLVDSFFFTCGLTDAGASEFVYFLFFPELFEAGWLMLVSFSGRFGVDGDGNLADAGTREDLGETSEEFFNVGEETPVPDIMVDTNFPDGRVFFDPPEPAGDSGIILEIFGADWEEGQTSLTSSSVEIFSVSSVDCGEFR